ncbi:hypothetical protein [Actinopolymorpha sp. B9G3]|uniref:hypothetical protein n=1 Tax=Actinopolymorpha sp. B9G3 TaxID=3158970 RepID=UPI0032D95260
MATDDSAVRRPFVTYKRPDAQPVGLGLRPRLASWDASGHPAQVELRHYLEYASAALSPQLQTLRAPWALRLDVGLPEPVPLLDQHDLDNYLYPLARHLSSKTSESLVSAWCTKQHGSESSVRVEPAEPAERADSARLQVRTTESAGTVAYKEQIREQIRSQAPLPDGPVMLELAFVVSRRNWLNLWKPTLDALDPLLGRTHEDRDWHPRDGRIVELGLHVVEDASVGHSVEIQIRVNSSTRPGRRLSDGRSGFRTDRAEPR